jgi:tripartite-type tricarboxylate transporter receptor subunit TctC
MKPHRRKFLHLAAGAGALPFSPHIARAQAYPTRPIHWIVSFAAGGPNDTVARIVGQFLSDKLGQQVIVENRVGAGGNIEATLISSSQPSSKCESARLLSRPIPFSVAGASNLWRWQHVMPSRQSTSGVTFRRAG